MIISKDAIKNILNRILKLDKKVDSHKHNISDVNNLQTTLNKKAPINYVSQFEGGAISSNFRKTIIGTTDMCGFAKSFRKNDSTDACMPQYGSGIAWGQADTHGMLCVDYINPTAYVAGGNGNKLNWYKQLAWKDDLANYSLTTHTHDYLPLSGGNLTGDLVLNAASEQHLTFNNCSKNKLQTYFYKGNSTNSTTIIGLWDPTNKEPIWKVNNDWSFEIGKQTTFWKKVILNNAMQMSGKTTAGDVRTMCVVGADNAMYLSDPNIHTYIRSSVTPQYLDSSGNKHDIYHSGNLNIGGRNYINNGNFTDGNVATPRGYWWWGGCSHYNLAVTGGTAIQNSSTSPGGLWTGMALSPNTQYTLSLRCTKENNVKGASWVFEYIKDGKTISSQQLGLTFDGAVHGYTFTTPNNGFTAAQGGLRHEGSNSTAGGYLVIIRYLKLEKGNKVTDYTESPSDIDYKINSKLNIKSTLMFAGSVYNTDGISISYYNYNSCCSTVTASADSSQKVLKFVAPDKGVYLFLVHCNGTNGANYDQYTIHIGEHSSGYTVVTSSQYQSGYTASRMNKGESTYVCYWSSYYNYGVTGTVTILRLSVN